MDKPQNKKYKYDYFISYADGDSEWVERFLIPRLTKGLGKKVVTNKETEKRYGKPKVLNLQDAVINSNQLILVITPEYQLKSKNDDYGYRKTIEVMKQSHDIVMESWRVIPLIFKETPLPLRLDFITPIDFTDESQWEVQLKNLVGSSDIPEKVFFVKPVSPYLGLDSFTEKDSQYFYGRNKVVDELKLRLTANQFIIVFGSSGSGKSSVIQAGLIPSIKKSEQREDEKSYFFSMTPNAKPITAIIELFGDDFLTDPERSLKKLLSRHNKKKLFIFIDQFEESFSIAKGDNKEFFGSISFFINSPKCSLVIASRSDFFEDLTKTPIWDSIESNIYRLLPLSKEELGDAISKPIRDVGGGISDLLVERMVNDAGTESGILPFVQVTMDLLWKDLEDGYLTLSDYEALTITDHNGQSIHGLKAAIALKAKSAMQELGKDNKKILRCILLRLIQFGENGAPDTRLPQKIYRLKNCWYKNDFVINTLISKDFRLLTTYIEKDEKIVKITHDSLIFGWPFLQDLILKYKKSELERRSIKNKIKKWKNNGKYPSYLFNKDELDNVNKWILNCDYENISVEREIIFFVDKSTEYYNKKRYKMFFLFFFLITSSPLIFYTSTLVYKKYLMFKSIFFIDKIYFSSGEFPIGVDSKEGEDIELHNPKTYFNWREYSIDRYEVTNSFYCSCFKAGVCKNPSYSNKVGNRVCDNEKKNLPVTNIDAYDAEVFCEWIGGRLPHEVEWEHAARGYTDRIYPYGLDKILPEKIQIDRDDYKAISVYEIRYDKTLSGIYGLSGNVREWTIGKILPLNRKEKIANISEVEEITSVRGLSYADKFSALNLSHRGFMESRNRSPFVGFRCAY